MSYNFDIEHIKNSKYLITKAKFSFDTIQFGLVLRKQNVDEET